MDPTRSVFVFRGVFRYNGCNTFISSMINQALFDVVKNQLTGGVSEQEVREFLRRRGSSDAEIRELLDEIASQSVTIRDIPISTTLPEVASIEPIPSIPTQSEAHGVVRNIPPLQPSVPFAPASPQPPVVDQPSEPTIAPILSPIISEARIPAVSSKKRPFIFVGAGMVAAVVLLMGGYVIYASYFASPEKVMDTMISRLRDVHSGEFSVDISVLTDSMSDLASTSTQTNPFLRPFAIQGPVTLALHASGTVDMRDEQKPAVAVVFSSTMDKWTMGDFALGGEYRNVDHVNYVKVDSVPDLGFLSLSFLKHQWFKAADNEAKAQLGGVSSGESSSVIPAVSQGQWDRFATAWKAHRFLTVAETLNSEDIDGAAMHHYKLAFDKNAFERFANAMDAVSDTAVLDADLNSITVNALELWIGKRDGLPHKLIAQVSLRDTTDPNKKSDVTIVMGANGFNTALDVAVPDGAKSVQEALQGVFGQMLDAQKAAPKTPKSRNDQRRSDVVLIADAISKNMTTHGDVFVCASGPLPVVPTFMGTAINGMSGYAMESCLVPAYMRSMPRDPSKGSSTMSGYSVLYNQATKKITVRAPYTEGGAIISITR